MGSCQSSPSATTQNASASRAAPQSNPASPGVSSTKKSPSKKIVKKTREKGPVDFILNRTANKPLDASDVTNLDDARKEIYYIRKFAAEFLATVDDTVSNIDDTQKGDTDDHEDKFVRGALYDKQDFSSFKKISYEKTDDIRTLIYDSIKPNVLFEHDTQEEILQIIDVFKPREYKKGEVVIKQGDEGSEFYVVESGELSIHVTVKGEDKGEGGESSQVKVGEYSKGSAFGELALIFGSPRAATITATSDCKLWSIERMAYRSVISQLRYEQHVEKNAFLRTCVVSDGRPFFEIFDASQIEDLTIATKVDFYEEGAVILREGEMGDTFYVSHIYEFIRLHVLICPLAYFSNSLHCNFLFCCEYIQIVKSGTVERYREDKDTGEEKLEGTVEKKKSFGTTSLLKGTPSPLTYKAASQVSLYYLTRKDFEAIMGNFKDALDGTVVSRGTLKSESKRTIKTSCSHTQRYEFELEELDFYNVLGRGAFGQVTLVQSKKTKKVFALKAQSKHYIAKKGQKEHVLNEYRIMKEIEHPNILGIHCAMQDDQHLYFLLDLLPGKCYL